MSDQPAGPKVITQDTVVDSLIKQLHAALNVPALILITLSVEHLDGEAFVKVSPNNVRASYPTQMDTPEAGDISALLHLMADGLEEGTIK